jgi:RimJ/RimL family protein N-acetyltransferase
MHELTTERLTLRPLTLADIEWFAAMRGDADIMRYIGTAGAVPRAIAEERLDRHVTCWNERGLGMFGARLHGNDDPLGWAGLQPLEGTDDIEVGYAFAKPWWGRGFATEAASALVRWGFEELGLERIVAVAYPENEPSRRVMDKLGMHYEGTRLVHGTDSVFYSLTPADFARATSPRESTP